MSTALQRKLLSPKDLAEAIGSSESSVKRWTDQGLLDMTRTAGGHRRIATAEAIRFIRKNTYPVIKPEILGLPSTLGREGTAEQRSTSDPNAIFLELLRVGEDVGARNHVLERFLAGERISSLADGPMRMAMEVIGDRKEHDARDIYIEHRATEICAGLLRDLRSYVLPVRPIGRAIGGAIGGDPYRLPPLAVSATLTECGFQTVNLGANTPIGVLEVASIGGEVAERPRIVWICLSTIDAVEEERAAIMDFAVRCREHEITLALGGRDLWKLDLENDDTVMCNQSLVSLAESVEARLGIGSED